MRFMFIRKNCNACLEYERVLPMVNAFLPINNQIVSLDNSDFEDYGIVTHPIQDALSGHFDSYPLIYLDGVILTGGTTKEVLQTFLKTYLKDELLMDIL